MVTFLNGWQVIHPKEVTMRSLKTTLLVLVLAAAALPVFAGDDAAVDKQQSDKDKSVVAPAQPAKEPGKQNRQAPKPEDKEEQAPESRPNADQSPQSRDRVEQAPSSESRDAEAPRYEPSVIRAPTPTRREESRVVVDPGQTSWPNVLRQPVPPPSGGRGGPGDGKGGYRGGPGGPGRRDHGRGWHGYHNDWRHRGYGRHGSWSFLFHFGPRIYFAPVHYPHIVRLPRTRVGVYVRQTGDDYVGVQFANAVREQLRGQGLRVVYSQDDARLELYLVSMEQDPDEPGYGSSISVSYIWYPGHRFITAQMVDAGVDQLDVLAQSVAEYADDLVDDYR